MCYLLIHIACTALDGKIPLLALTGITPDISIILLFTFYQPVFYATYDQNFPSESEARAVYCIGFGEHCGHAMTHKIFKNNLTIYFKCCRVADSEADGKSTDAPGPQEKGARTTLKCNWTTSSSGERMEEIADGMILACACGSAFLDAAENQRFPGVEPLL